VRSVALGALRRGFRVGLAAGMAACLAGSIDTRTAPAGTEREAMMEAYEKLKQLVAEVEENLKKTEGGNKAAGTRVRHSMQLIKETAQEIREKVLEMRDAGKTP